MGNTAADFSKSLGDRTHRDRIQTTKTGNLFSEYWVNTPPTKPTVPLASGYSARCVDVNHPHFNSFLRYRSKKANRWNRIVRNGDVGGPLCIEKVSMSTPVSVDVINKPLPGVIRGYKGIYAPSVRYKNLMTDLANSKFPIIPADLGTSMESFMTLGSKAVSRSIPDIPDFSLSRFIGELREGLPKVPLKVLAQEKKLRNVGGEYLNFQFGIAPFAQDLQDIVHIIQRPAFRSAIKKNLDAEFRVRKVLDKGESQTTRPLTFAELQTAQGLTGNSGTLTTKSSYRIWSSISFAYYQMTMLEKLLSDFDRETGNIGVLPTAIDIWNLVPWSWLVDWFVSFNHVITNLSYLGKDGLYMQRGYLMGHFEQVELHEQSGSIYGTFARTSGTITYSRKYRIHASPFGFGITWKEFSPFQTSILASLGVNRLRF